MQPEFVPCSIRDCPTPACFVLCRWASGSGDIAVCNDHYNALSSPHRTWRRLRLPRPQAGVAGDDFDIPRGLGW